MRDSAGTSAARGLAGLAGLGYIAGIAIENMSKLEAPTLNSALGEIRAFFADQTLLMVTTAAGAVSLVSYCLLAVALFAYVRGAEGAGERWALLGLAGGMAGAAAAAVGLGAQAMLVEGGGTGLSADRTRSLFELSVNARILSGLFVAMFLAGFGIATLRTATLPSPLARFACVLAVPMALAPIAAFTDGSALRLAATLLFACQALWIFAISVWLGLGEDVSLPVLARRSAFLLLVFAAGLVGLGLLAAPGATEQFFAWGLAPAPLAAFAGGVYVASATV